MQAFEKARKKKDHSDKGKGGMMNLFDDEKKVLI
jgi:hypothetical protein